ncbi:MAG: hypothetical protein ABL901_07290 [Hyphomicrobiaceae bacterium]
MARYTNLAAAVIACTLVSAPAVAQTKTHRPAYGCFKVTVPELNIRQTAFSSGAVVATAIKNEILVKRRRFCALRGFWCAVTTNKGVPGYADKSMIAVAACPARLSQ